MISILGPKAAKSLAGQVIVSNTPRFFYKFLLKNSFVENLSQRYSTKDLTTLAKEISKQGVNLEEKFHLDVYALIGALSLQYGTEAVNALLMLSTVPVRWAKELCEMAQESTFSYSTSAVAQQQTTSNPIFSNTLGTQQKTIILTPEAPLR